MIFALGILMLFLGLPMLLVGKVTLPGNVVIPARRSRLSAAILLSFFPLALLLHFVLAWFSGLDFLFVQLAYWALAGACLVGAFVPLAPVFFRSRKR